MTRCGSWTCQPSWSWSIAGLSVLVSAASSSAFAITSRKAWTTVQSSRTRSMFRSNARSTTLPLRRPPHRKSQPRRRPTVRQARERRPALAPVDTSTANHPLVRSLCRPWRAPSAASRVRRPVVKEAWVAFQGASKVACRTGVTDLLLYRLVLLGGVGRRSCDYAAWRLVGARRPQSRHRGSVCRVRGNKCRWLHRSAGMSAKMRRRSVTQWCHTRRKRAATSDYQWSFARWAADDVCAGHRHERQQWAPMDVILVQGWRSLVTSRSLCNGRCRCLPLVTTACTDLAAFVAPGPRQAAGASTGTCGVRGRITSAESQTVSLPIAL